MPGAAELGEELENARLHGDVERGGDLVADEELGLRGERSGDRDALLLAAAQLSGHAVRNARREMDLFEQLGTLASSSARDRSKNWRRGRRTMRRSTCAG